MYWWVRQYPVSNAAQEAEVENKSGIQVYTIFGRHLQLEIDVPHMLECPD